MIILAKVKKTVDTRIFFLSVLALFLFSVVLFVGSRTGSGADASKDTGYDEFGYNYVARLFNGKLDGADRNLDGTYWGDKTYANDKLVMKWSKTWDDARFHGQPWSCDAWVDNEENGKVAGGSGEVWHYKISWVGSEMQKSSCWRPGGYPIWGEFEVLMDQGTVANQHFWNAHASPNGYGMY